MEYIVVYLLKLILAIYFVGFIYVGFATYFLCKKKEYPFPGITAFFAAIIWPDGFIKWIRGKNSAAKKN